MLRLVDVLPMPSLRTQRLVALAVVLTQGGIAVTGAIVRVTASGLGCPTWPQCFPGSFTPVPVAEVPVIHQAVEFGNRMITFLVVLTAALAVLTLTRARRRREVLVYAWLMPASTIVQAVIGGITVLTGLLWWTVAIHLLASMTMVWLSVLLYVKVGEPDRGVADVARAEAHALVGRADRGDAVGGARHRNAGDRRGAARGRQERRTAGAAPSGGDHHAGAPALDAVGGLPGPRRRPRLRAACGLARRGRCGCAGRCCSRWCARRAWWARCSSSPACPPHWSPCTSPGRPHARQPPRRYGRRCENGPSPSRSRADSTPMANSRCCLARSASPS